ncbi:MAG: LptF/LptG family permease [Fimbriimonadaceae bacterium]|nr:LptF/LptG family permease [Fimbriimonadaceae bacterium]
MKRIDGLIIRELIGPWGFGVAIFTSLVFATALLNRISDWVVSGVDPGTILQLSLLLMPGIMTKTFAMALLLASLLGFGRLSNDSEIVAMRAAGASLYRLVLPVLIFSTAVAGLTFAINESFVPWAAGKANALQEELQKQISDNRKTRSVSQKIKGPNGSSAWVLAEDFNLLDKSLINVVIVVMGRDGEPTYLVTAEKLVYRDEKDWKIEGKALLRSVDGVDRIELEQGALPSEVPKPDFEPKNLLAGFLTDLDVLSMPQIRQEIERMRRQENPDLRQIANLEFGYYNKIALPLAAVVFGLLGAPLGIRNHRTGVGAGFALSVLLSFGYLTLANFMAVYSRSGLISPAAASFMPCVIGLVAAAITIWKKNG